MTNDPFIGLEFNKKDHIYTYKGQELESVTRFIEQFQKPFDREFWSKRKAKQEGITQEEMLKKWDDKSQLALACGTEVHEMIESFLKEELIEPHQDAMQRAANLFNGWRDWWLKRKQVETSAIEWRMFNEAWGIAGTADLLTKNRDEYILLDWKTNEKFSTDNKFDNLLSPFDQFQDCDLNKYSLQLSLYMLLAQKAGIPISSAWIIHISEKITAYKVWDHLFIHELERILDKRII